MSTLASNTLSKKKGRGKIPASVFFYLREVFAASSLHVRRQRNRCVTVRNREVNRHLRCIRTLGVEHRITTRNQLAVYKFPSG